MNCAVVNRPCLDPQWDLDGKAGKGNIVLHGFLKLRRGPPSQIPLPAHARSQEPLAGQLELLRCYYNFVRSHGGLKFGREVRTPAMQAGLVARRLTFRDVFTAVA